MRNSTKNNIVPQEILSEVQIDVLKILTESLINSFGPDGSNTCIKLNNAYNHYTKDGHEILKNIHFHGIMEESIREDIESVTRHIVKTVGDGTTSAIILSKFILESITKYLERNKNKVYPADCIKAFEKVANIIAEDIRNHASECDPNKIYDIAMISTNGNEFIAKTLKDIYAKHGMEVFIDVTAGTNEQTAIKTYNGITLDTGFTDPCYITDITKNEAVVDNPNIYFFMDPIDTRGMMALFDSILSNNIVVPYNAYVKTNGNTSVKIIPTVIIAPKISRDMSSLMKVTLDTMSHLPSGQKLPLLIITNFHQNNIIEDLAKLCNAKPIMKYIDEKVYKKDVELGRAPTPDTVTKFAGTCESVVANSSKTSFINPCEMYNPDGSRSEVYNSLITFLEKDLSTAIENGEGPNVTGGLKRRIHALKSDLVEIIVGGIDQTDRDALRALVEDAVLNCRSAAKNGVGYGANFMGLNSSYNINNIKFNNINEDSVAYFIFESYKNLTSILYRNKCINGDYEAMIKNFIDKKQPMNLRTCEFDGKVLSSIESDIIILKTVVKIVSMMATCNQYITPTPMHNVYVD